MSRCAACPGTNNCVPGDGPCNKDDLFFLFEAPGRDEDRHKKMLIGKTGEETNRHYLPLAGLRRENVRVENAISCLPTSSQGRLDPKKRTDLELLDSCVNHHVYPYLEQYTPRLIIPCGSFACRAIDPSIDLELQHGIPVATDWGVAFPMYHPAGGIHEPKKMLQIRTDWIRLKRYLVNQLRIPRDEYAGKEYYGEITSPSHLLSLLEGCNDYTMGCDTETKKGGDPFCLTFSIAPGTGFLIKADRPDILQLFQSYISKWQGHILWHNWMFDKTVTDKMGLTFPHHLIKDTMEKAFHLGNVPQGLKALAYRELGMQMQDFDDLVTPYSRELVLNYYREMKLIDWPKPEPEMYRTAEGQWKLKKPHGLTTKVKTFFTYFAKDEEKDVFEAWENWESCQEMVEAELGPYPGKCISHAPFDKVLHYACRDADALLRLWPIITFMQGHVRERKQEDWALGYTS